MKVVIECENCGNKVEITPETIGKVAYFERRLLDHNFTIYGTTIDVELQQDTVSDTDDVETTLKEIRINCDNCGEYICLYFQFFDLIYQIFESSKRKLF